MKWMCRAVTGVLGSAGLVPAPVTAGLPAPGAGIDPVLSSASLSGQTAGCQFRFHPNGTGDVLTVIITLRDWFNQPVADCSTSVTLVPAPGTETFNVCTCCGERQTGATQADGTLQIAWNAIGGFGTLEARVTTHCQGNLALASLPFDFTSSDLSGTCGSAGTVSISDLALWGRGVTPGAWRPADWDCSGGSADVFDFGGLAGGYDTNCGPCP